MKAKLSVSVAALFACLSLCGFACGEAGGMVPLQSVTGSSSSDTTSTESPSSTESGTSSTESSQEESSSTENSSTESESSSTESGSQVSSSTESSSEESSSVVSSPEESSSSVESPPPHTHEYQNGACSCGDLEYMKLSGDGSYYIVTGWSNAREVVIPASYGGKAVREIASGAFRGKEITSVSIVGGVTKIGASAFLRCGSLERVTIGEAVTSIGALAFSGCTALVEVSFEAATGWTANDWSLPTEMLSNGSVAAKCLKGELVEGLDFKPCAYEWKKEG